MTSRSNLKVSCQSKIPKLLSPQSRTPSFFQGGYPPSPQNIHQSPRQPVSAKNSTYPAPSSPLSCQQTTESSDHASTSKQSKSDGERIRKPGDHYDFRQAPHGMYHSPRLSTEHWGQGEGDMPRRIESQSSQIGKKISKQEMETALTGLILPSQSFAAADEESPRLSQKARSQWDVVGPSSREHAYSSDPKSTDVRILYASNPLRMESTPSVPPPLHRSSPTYLEMYRKQQQFGSQVLSGNETVSSLGSGRRERLFSPTRSEMGSSRTLGSSAFKTNNASLEWDFTAEHLGSEICTQTSRTVGTVDRASSHISFESYSKESLLENQTQPIIFTDQTTEQEEESFNEESEDDEYNFEDLIGRSCETVKMVSHNAPVTGSHAESVGLDQLTVASLQDSCGEITESDEEHEHIYQKRQQEHVICNNQECGEEQNRQTPQPKDVCFNQHFQTRVSAKETLNSFTAEQNRRSSDYQKKDIMERVNNHLSQTSRQTAYQNPVQQERDNREKTSNYARQTSREILPNFVQQEQDNTDRATNYSSQASHQKPSQNPVQQKRDSREKVSNYPRQTNREIFQSFVQQEQDKRERTANYASRQEFHQNSQVESNRPFGRQGASAPSLQNWYSETERLNKLNMSSRGGAIEVQPSPEPLTFDELKLANQISEKIMTGGGSTGSAFSIPSSIILHQSDSKQGRNLKSSFELFNSTSFLQGYKILVNSMARKYLKIYPTMGLIPPHGRTNVNIKSSATKYTNEELLKFRIIIKTFRVHCEDPTKLRDYYNALEDQHPELIQTKTIDKLLIWKPDDLPEMLDMINSVTDDKEREMLKEELHRQMSEYDIPVRGRSGVCQQLTSLKMCLIAANQNIRNLYDELAHMRHMMFVITFLGMCMIIVQHVLRCMGEQNPAIEEITEVAAPPPEPEPEPIFIPDEEEEMPYYKTIMTNIANLF